VQLCVKWDCKIVLWFVRKTCFLVSVGFPREPTWNWFWTSTKHNTHLWKIWTCILQHCVNEVVRWSSDWFVRKIFFLILVGFPRKESSFLNIMEYMLHKFLSASRNMLYEKHLHLISFLKSSFKNEMILIFSPNSAIPYGAWKWCKCCISLRTVS
jgi:hypothetical protein